MEGSKKWKQQGEISPDSTKVWIEPPKEKHRKVPVIYYLSSNGQLQHPHFMEVPLSSNEGLYLKDVISHLNFLRGMGMGSKYSWSCKRRYKTGFVWHDLSENDLVYPAHGQEYVLKGSELVENKLFETDSSLISKKNPSPPESSREEEGEVDILAMHRRRPNQSCSSIDLNLHEYCVYKAESSGSASADASTQTIDKRRRRHRRPEHNEIVEEKSNEAKETTPPLNQNTTEKDEIEISPPSSNSSSETLETLMKSDGRLILLPETVNKEQIAKNHRARTSSILMQLLSCGSISFKGCGPGRGLSLISQYKMRLPRCRGSGELIPGTGRMKMEEKEYFSGSLVETKKEDFPALKRSSSYNADRSSQLELEEKRLDGMTAKCIPKLMHLS